MRCGISSLAKPAGRPEARQAATMSRCSLRSLTPALASPMTILSCSPRFTRSTSRTRSQQGTGLGLAICLKLVRLMHGDMSLASSGVGCGSRFAFTAKLGRRLRRCPRESCGGAAARADHLGGEHMRFLCPKREILVRTRGSASRCFDRQSGQKFAQGKRRMGRRSGHSYRSQYMPKSAVLSPHLREEFSAMFNSEAVPEEGADCWG